MPIQYNPKKLLVEGKEDERVIPYLMEANGIDSCFVARYIVGEFIVFSRSGASEECLVKAEELARLIDHSHLRANATQTQIQQACDEAVEHGFAMVTVNPSWTTYCAKRLKGTGVGINPTIGFPLGANTARMKVAGHVVPGKTRGDHGFLLD